MALFSFLQPKASAPTAAAVQTQFGLNLFLKTAQSSPGNVLVSPLGVLAALALAMNGASGTTHETFGQVLFGSPNGTEKAFAAWLQQLLQSSAFPKTEGNEHTDKKGIQLNLAASMWADQRFTLASAFIEQARALYGAKAGILDFTTPAASSTINGWVQECTQGRIPSIVDAEELMRSAPAAVLLSAVYFQAQWASPFYAANTRPDWFRQADGGQQEAQFMRKLSSRFGYLAGKGWQAVALPYASVARGYAMWVFLPDKPDGLPAFLAGLNAANWAEWHRAFAAPSQADVHLTLPRFRVEWGADLVPVLHQLGLSIAFAPGADFSAMGFRAEEGGGFISEVLHKTFLEVNEAGTEAAAATAVTMMIGGAMPKPRPRVELKVDSPFFYAVVDEQDGCLIFAGSVNTLP